MKLSTSLPLLLAAISPSASAKHSTVRRLRSDHNTAEKHAANTAAHRRLDDVGDDTLFVETLSSLGGGSDDYDMFAEISQEEESEDVVTTTTDVTTSPIPSMGSISEAWRIPQSYPEGIAYDKTNNRILLSSLVSNTIMALDATNDMFLQTTYTPDTIDNASGMGMKVDEATGQVYATLTNFSTQDNGGFVVYDLPVTADATAAATAAATPLYMPCTDGETKCGLANDLVINGGVTYITDSALGRLFKVENGVRELVTEDPLLLWQDANAPFGSNGLVHDERGFIVLGNYEQKSLVRVDLTSSEVMAIPVEGEIANPDGLLMDSNGRLFVTTGATIYVVTDNDDEWKSATVVGTIDVAVEGAEGESATDIAFGATEDEIFVTYCRFNDLFDPSVGTNTDPSLLARVAVGDVAATTTVAPVDGATTTAAAATTEAPPAETVTTTAPASSDDTSSASIKTVGVTAIAAGLTAMLF